MLKLEAKLSMTEVRSVTQVYRFQKNKTVQNFSTFIKPLMRMLLFSPPLLWSIIQADYYQFQ